MGCLYVFPYFEMSNRSSGVGNECGEGMFNIWGKYLMVS